MKVFGYQVLQKKKDLVDVNLKGTENKLTVIFCIYLRVINPLVVSFKRLFQQVCLSKISWEAVVMDEVLQKWRKIISDLDGCSQIIVPRLYGSFSRSKVCRTHVQKCAELHNYSDRSLGAYVCCIYINSHDDSFVISLVTSESRVSHIKRLSIPKLELQDAVSLAKVMLPVQKEFLLFIEVSFICCWSDSMVALRWIHGIVSVETHLLGQEWMTFKFGVNCWHYVESNPNPTGLLSRTFLFSEILQKDL